MITIVLKRSAEPTVIQMTQELIMKELALVNNSEMLLVDSWSQGLQQVRTPLVCLLEADCLLNPEYFMASLAVFPKNIKGRLGKGAGGGGYTKLAMLSPCLCTRDFANRTFGYTLDNDSVQPVHQLASIAPYHIQVGFVPGAIIRYNSIKDILPSFDWDNADLVKLSLDLSVHFWNTGRRIKLHPDLAYVSSSDNLGGNRVLTQEIPSQVRRLFSRDFDILNNPKVKL